MEVGNVSRDRSVYDIGESDLYEIRFLDKIQEHLGSTIIPQYLRNALSIYGFAKGPILAESTELQIIQALQDFVRSPDYAVFIPAGTDLQRWHGIFQRRPESFEVLYAGKVVLSKIVNLAKTSPLKFWDPFASHPEIEEVFRGQDLAEDIRCLIDVSSDIRKQNEGREDHGNRCPRGIRLFCAFSKLSAGRLVYETLARVFRKSIPGCSTINKFIRPEGEHIIEGRMRVAQLKKFLTDRNLPLEVSLSEDACAIVNKIRYDVLTDQGVGVVLPRDRNKMPIPGSFPAKTAPLIEKIFNEGEVSRLLDGHMVQHLADNAPSFCLLMYGTNGKYTADDVIKYSNYVSRTLLEESGIVVRYICSDGDPKLLRAHRIMSGLSEKQYSDTPCVITIKGESIELPEYHAYVKQTMILNQDKVHVITKCRNALIKDSVVLAMGNRMASFTDLEDLICIQSKDKHQLTATDLKPKDKMHFKSVLKGCKEKTIAQLKEHVPRSEATQMYLSCRNSMARAFLFKTITIEERVYNMWYPLYFFRLWRYWLSKHPVHAIKDNFISSNTYMCIELNGHCLLQMVLIAIENDDYELYTWLVGSQICESFFEVFRCDSTVQSLMVNCTVLEGTKKLRKTQLLQDILAYDFEKEDNIDIEFPRDRFLHPSFETGGFRGDEISDAISSQPIKLGQLRATLDVAKRDALPAATRLGMLNLDLSHADKCQVAEIPLNSIDIYVDEEDDDDNIDENLQVPPDQLAWPNNGSSNAVPNAEIQEDVNFLSSMDNLQLVDYSEKEDSILRWERETINSSRSGHEMAQRN
ncbi:hypothetical protein QAD02_018459 [Eretmocerus hayati]|uniref:Uncharacterized protein n=1 Tax=Eretmocerus hayati TaxID=131215 RepID=A0ACC2PGR5_9HYME|nr:hypothetical protein QAD02_018459 [Eretmocerus hayati]